MPCDDSVVRVVDGAELPVRRSRGYAPLPVALPFEVRADAGRRGRPEEHLLPWPTGRYAWLSQHVGDMDDLATLRRASTRAERHLSALTGVAPDALVADAHPGYRSTALGPRARRRPPGARPCSTTTRTSPR